MRSDDSHTCSNTSFWEAMGQAGAHSVFNGNEGCGHPAISDCNVGWGPCIQFSCTGDTEAHLHPVPACAAPPRCQKTGSHLYADAVLRNPHLHDCKHARTQINFCDSLATADPALELPPLLHGAINLVSKKQEHKKNKLCCKEGFCLANHLCT